MRRALQGYTVITIKSTVPVGTGQELKNKLRECNHLADFDLASNPEFLREGVGVDDFMNPSRLIIGTETDRARDALHKLYAAFKQQEVPIVDCSLETAELIKYASNAFLATKITFINEMADLCEKAGADVRKLAYGMGLDERIGKRFLNAGPGYGGSCFPKDTAALAYTARDAGTCVRIVEAVVEINESRKADMAARVARFIGESQSVANRIIAVLGLTFKPQTDDLRESPSVSLIAGLQELGAVVRAHDPVGAPNAGKVLKDVVYFDEVYDSIRGADALVIATGWSDYRGMDIERVKRLLNSPVIVDFHNLYDVGEMQSQGVRYLGIGQGQANLQDSNAL